MDTFLASPFPILLVAALSLLALALSVAGRLLFRRLLARPGRALLAVVLSQALFLATTRLAASLLTSGYGAGIAIDPFLLCLLASLAFLSGFAAAAFLLPLGIAFLDRRRAAPPEPAPAPSRALRAYRFVWIPFLLVPLALIALLAADSDESAMNAVALATDFSILAFGLLLALLLLPAAIRESLRRVSKDGLSIAWAMSGWAALLLAALPLGSPTDPIRILLPTAGLLLGLRPWLWTTAWAQPGQDLWTDVWPRMHWTRRTAILLSAASLTSLLCLAVFELLDAQAFLDGFPWIGPILLATLAVAALSGVILRFGKHRSGALASEALPSGFRNYEKVAWSVFLGAIPLLFAILLFEFAIGVLSLEIHLWEGGW